MNDADLDLNIIVRTPTRNQPAVFQSRILMPPSEPGDEKKDLNYCPQLYDTPHDFLA